MEVRYAQSDVNIFVQREVYVMCSQQALYYITMTYLTVRIQSSCIALVKNKTNQTYKFLSPPPCTCLAIHNGEQGD